jgi:hypothetical protein
MQRIAVIAGNSAGQWFALMRLQAKHCANCSGMALASLVISVVIVNDVLFMFYNCSTGFGFSNEGSDVYAAFVGVAMIAHFAWRFYLGIIIERGEKLQPWLRYRWAKLLHRYWLWVPVPLFQFVLWIPELVLIASPVDPVFHTASSQAQTAFATNRIIVVVCFGVHWFLEILAFVLSQCLRPCLLPATREPTYA